MYREAQGSSIQARWLLYIDINTSHLRAHTNSIWDVCECDVLSCVAGACLRMCVCFHGCGWSDMAQTAETARLSALSASGKQ